MTSPNPASSHSPLSSTTNLPIAQLDPLLSSLPSKSIKAVVTLIWPYSSSKRSISLLLAEPDFRLRRNRGQVRVHFHGSAARTVARREVRSGDVVNLGLEGAEWLRVEESPVPGRGVDWELTFTERLLMELNREAHQSAVLDIDHPTPSPEPEVQASSPPRSPSSQLPSISSQPLSQLAQATPLNEWSSPAFLKRARISSGSIFGSSYDLFADSDGFIEGKGRKRTRFWRETGQWRYMDRTPSPEKEIPAAPTPEEVEDAMDMDENGLGSSSGLDARKPSTEEQALDGSVLGCEEPKEPGLDFENERMSPELNMENFSRVGGGAAGRHEKELQVQESDLNLAAVHDMEDIPAGLREPTTSPQPADYTALPVFSGIYADPHMPRPPIAPLQIGSNEDGVIFDLQETPSSPILRPVPSPSLPAVSPFGSSWTETIDRFDPLQTRTLPGSEAASTYEETDEHERPDRGDQCHSTSSPTTRTSDPNIGEQLEPDMDGPKVAGAHSTTMPRVVRSTVMTGSGGLEGEQESLRTYNDRVRDTAEMDDEMEDGSESETDEFGDDEREQLHSTIIPQMRQFATEHAIDERELQTEIFGESQGSPHSSVPPKASHSVGTGVGVLGSESSEDSDDLQSMSLAAQMSDVEADEEYESDEEQYEERLEGYGDVSEEDESESDEEESHSSSSSPVPQKRATTQEVEVIDLISDDEDEPQQGAQSEMAATQSSHFGLDGMVMPSLAPEPGADSFAEQWDKVIAARNESRNERSGSVEKAGESVVHQSSLKADGRSISQAQVGPEVSSQAQPGVYEIEQMEASESERGSLKEEQVADIVGKTQSQILETQQYHRMEILRENEPEIGRVSKAPTLGEAQSASGSAVGTPPMADCLSGKGVIGILDAGDDGGGANAIPRVDTAPGKTELPPDRGAEGYEAQSSRVDPQRHQHHLSSPIASDPVSAQLQLEYPMPPHQGPESENRLASEAEIQYPTLPAVQNYQYSYSSSFVDEPYIQIPKTTFEEEPGLQLPTPDETQRTLVSSQLSAFSVHPDVRTTLDATIQGLSIQNSLPPTPQAYPAPMARQEAVISPLFFASPLSQEQPPFTPPASQLEGLPFQFPVLSTQGSQALPETSQHTQITSPELLETPTPPQASLLQKLREIKGASGKRERESRNAVPDVISPWFTTKDACQSGIGTGEDTPSGARASPPLADGEQSPLPENGHAVSHSPTTTSPTADAAGIATPLSYFSLLSTLQVLFSNVVDVLAIVTRHQPAKKAKRGSRDHVLSLAITDPSISTSVSVVILRPFKSALPIVSDGDGILLRGFKVTSQKQKLLLQSTDVSSWAVFGSDGEVQVRGPPVEHGGGEAQEIESLKQWWQALEVQTRGEVAAGARDERRGIADGLRSEPTESPREAAKSA
ncbi:MAG: hypothetical protein M1839_008848 [Geoglossum umbratile]|nr:MAG: hypothetical protein M1839_008848 [Geoglossum umbratile]